MKRIIVVVVVVALLVGAGWFVFTRNGNATAQTSPAVQSHEARPTSLPVTQSAPLAKTVGQEETRPANSPTTMPTSAPVSPAPGSTTDAAGRVIEELIQSKLDGRAIEKLYSYDENGNVSREAYIDPTNGHVIEYKEHRVDADGRAYVRIIDYKGQVLDASKVQ